MKRVAVLISGRGSNLQSLIDAAPASDEKGSYRIILVLSNKPDAAGLDRARAAGIATALVPHAGKSREDFDTEVDAVLRAAGAEIVVLAGFMR
ncbi:MAG TPA: formyltransferase family protein, partial [Rhizomicrobium sp.]